MAELDIAERRVPQDGRIGLTVDGRYIDLRVATLPVIRGESVVMRILDKDRVIIDLDRLGMERARPRAPPSARSASIHGAVLVTGPTGAGKTTTLYAALNEVNTPDRTLIAIEDPVEYELDGIKQVQVNPKAGLDFAAGLRSMVRSDPDVLMVGEIRDRETAQIAIESALTGHLVLSTLHTNDATDGPRPPDRHGHRALPDRLGPRVRRRPAPGPAPLRGVPQARAGDPRGAGPERFRLHRRRLRGLRARWLRPLRRLGLPRPGRPV